MMHAQLPPKCSGMEVSAIYGLLRQEEPVFGSIAVSVETKWALTSTLKKSNEFANVPNLPLRMFRLGLEFQIYTFIFKN